MNETFIQPLIKLDRFVREKNFKGFDPYDALNATRIKCINNKWVKVFFTQLFVYSPLNFRVFFGIKEDINPKAIGLFLSAYCKMYKAKFINEDDFRKISSELVRILLDRQSNGYSGNCWGFNFDWQDVIRYAPKKTPTIVISSYVGQSFLDLFDITHERKYLKIAENICQFIINDLHISKFYGGICFSYTPLDKHIVHNANCLGAAFLGRVYSKNNNPKLLTLAKKALDFSLDCQREDGSWAYRLDIEKGKERNQIDFHQGFIINSIIDFAYYTCSHQEKYIKAISNAGEFYINNQFDKFGRAKWRLPLSWPVDIHNQAQGIISCAKLYDFLGEKKFLEGANRIALWTINKMQNKNGNFYYQRWPFLTNKTNYMRWGQAWMILALTYLLDEKHG